MLKGLNATVSYTWSKSIDNASEARSVVPSYSANLNVLQVTRGMLSRTIEMLK